MARKEPTEQEPQTAYQQALERIEACRREGKGGTHLDLSGLGLTTVPPEIAKLTALTTLYLHSNQLSSLPPEIAKLTALTTLYLNSNQLSSLPPEIPKLTALSRLSLARNQLSSLLPQIAKLTVLTQLDISSNQLSSLPPEIGKLTAMTELYLDSNQLSSLPPQIAKLTALSRLSLSSNQLSSLPPEIGKLTALSRLYLDSNQLSSLPPEIAKLTALEHLFLHDNPSLGIPQEILGPALHECKKWGGDLDPASPVDILSYYFKSRQEAKPLNEIKLLLVGRGKAGKSSIRDRLLHNQFNEGKEETPGIDIQPWDLNCGDETVHVHVWDFAGQEITHSTHQFFLTERSVYVLVLEGRTDQQDRDAEYWLQLVAAFGKDSPVVIALNQWEAKPFEVDEHLLRERFPMIRAIIPTDCRSGLGMDDLKREIASIVQESEAVHQTFPAAWWAVKERFSKPQENYLPFANFRQICSENAITDTQEQESLARILHRLGIVLHYADDMRLRDTTVLNPQWVTNGVYTLLRLKERPGTDGVLALDEAAAALPNEPKEMVAYLIGLMRRFELCYPLDVEETRWLVPQLLAKYQPRLDAEWAQAAEATRLRYRYKVVPEGLLPRFIVRTHPLSEGEGAVRWRSGVVLGLDMARALVRMEPTENRISVTVTGPEADRLRLVKVIRSHFATMHTDLRGLNPKEEMEVNGHPGIYKDVRVLELNEQGGHKKVTTIDTDQGSVEINETQELNRVSAPAARKTDHPRVKLFVSYARADSGLLDVFKTNLEVMKMDGLMDWWFDGHIQESAEWDQEIRKELEEADIVVLMVSTAFLSRPYIRGVELGRAIERRTAGEAELFILVLEPACAWKGKRQVKQRVYDPQGKPAGEKVVEINLGTYQAATPRTKVPRWPKRPEAFNHVDAPLREMIERVLEKKRGRNDTPCEPPKVHGG